MYNFTHLNLKLPENRFKWRRYYTVYLYMNMGLSDKLGGERVIFKRKFRWLFRIPDVATDGVFALPNMKSGRPNFSFKESGFQHLNEEIFFPMKTDWKPINLTLYDMTQPIHPVIEWISKVYDISPTDTHVWFPSVPGRTTNIRPEFKKLAWLELYDGCGKEIERWKLECCWPQSADFGDLDMANNEIIAVNVTLRYDRATWIKGC